MGVTYHFGYPNMQRIVAIDEAVNNAQNGEKYQVNYRGKYRPLTVIEVPIEMLVYRIENIRTKSLQKTLPRLTTTIRPMFSSKSNLSTAMGFLPPIWICSALSYMRHLMKTFSVMKRC